MTFSSLFQSAGEFFSANQAGILMTGGVVFGLIVLIWMSILANQRVVVYIENTAAVAHQKRRMLWQVKLLFRTVILYLLGTLATILTAVWFPKTHEWLVAHLEAPVAFVTRQILVGAVFVVAWEICYFFLRRVLIGRSGAASQRAQTLFPVSVNVMTIALIVIYGFMLLGDLGVNIAPLLTGAGVAGVAVALGAQKSIQDIISGFTIIIEDLLQIGDVVKIGTYGGLVERITLRKIQLRGFDGTVMTIPYSQVTIIENMTKDFSFYVFNIGVAYDTDIGKAFDAIRAVDEAMRADENFAPMIVEPTEINGVDAFGDSAITIKARIKTQPVKQWAVGREFNRRLKEEFDRVGIEIPFPQRVVHMRPETKSV